MSAVLQENDTDLSITLHMTPDMTTLIRSGIQAPAVADAFVVDSADMAQIASNERTDLAQRIDRIKAAKAEFVEPAKLIIARAEAMFDPAIHALTDARDLLGKRITDWTMQERKRIAEENATREAEARRLRQEAESKAAAERARAEEQAAAERRKAEEAEQRRQAAIAEGNQRAAAAAAAEAAKAAEKAAAVLENAEASAQQELLQAAASAPAPVEEPVKIAGTQIRDNWVLEPAENVTEDQAKALICKAITEGRTELLGLLKLDMAAANRMAKALKANCNIPGMRAVNKPVAAGARK